MKYCIYITKYLGILMPPNYIGSSSIQRVVNGYHGSVRSKKWQLIWENELSQHPDKFVTEIISTHSSREEALQEELKIQKKFNVVLSEDWVNEAYAQSKGYAGRDVSSENNPMFGRGDKIIKWCADNPELASERNRKAANTQWKNPDTRSNRISAMKGKLKTRKTLTEDEFYQLQKAKSHKSAQQRKVEIKYNGSVYYGWLDLLDRTGVTKYLYNKYYLAGQDPLARKGANGPTKQQ